MEKRDKEEMSRRKFLKIVGGQCGCIGGSPVWLCIRRETGFIRGFCIGRSACG